MFFVTPIGHPEARPQPSTTGATESALRNGVMTVQMKDDRSDRQRGQRNYPWPPSAKRRGGGAFHSASLRCTSTRIGKMVAGNTQQNPAATHRLLPWRERKNNNTECVVGEEKDGEAENERVGGEGGRRGRQVPKEAEQGTNKRNGENCQVRGLMVDLQSFRCSRTRSSRWISLAYFARMKIKRS